MSKETSTSEEKLENLMPPIRDFVLDKLKEIYAKDPATGEWNKYCWSKFFEAAERDPENVKFYIFRYPGFETQPTLKIGLNDDKEADEQGFSLPFTLQQAIKLLDSLTPEDYRNLCRYAALKYIEYLQEGVNKDDKDDFFIESILREIRPITKLLEELNKEEPGKDWREVIQLYYEQ